MARGSACERRARRRCGCACIAHSLTRPRCRRRMDRVQTRRTGVQRSVPSATSIVPRMPPAARHVSTRARSRGATGQHPGDTADRHRRIVGQRPTEGFRPRWRCPGRSQRQVPPQPPSRASVAANTSQATRLPAGPPPQLGDRARGPTGTISATPGRFAPTGLDFKRLKCVTLPP